MGANNSKDITQPPSSASSSHSSSPNNDTNNNSTKKWKLAEQAANNTSEHPHDVFDLDTEVDMREFTTGALRGVAAATRKLLIAKGPAMKQSVRAVGENRHLAFASEGAVAGESIMPKVLYYGAWGLSATAIAADIYTKQHDAPPDLHVNTAIYWTAFHIPASLVVPALIIHQIVHQVDHMVQNPKGLAKAWPPRAKVIAPVAAALLSIIPVVPVVDHAAEAIMEPTLGKYLGLKFEHHHHHHQVVKEEKQQ